MVTPSSRRPVSQPPRGRAQLAGRADLLALVLDLGGFQFCDLGIRGNSSRAAGSQGSDERSAPPPCAFRERERGDHGGLMPDGLQAFDGLRRVNLDCWAT